MTFEAMDTRASAASAEETTAPVERHARRAVRRDSPVEIMTDYAVYGEVVATRLRGLAVLFRGVFCDDDVRRSDEASAAADIIDDVLKSIADGLDASAETARAKRDHLVRGGAR